MALKEPPQQDAANSTLWQREALEREVAILDKKITDLAEITARDFTEMATQHARARDFDRRIFRHRSTTVFRGGQGPLGGSWVTRELPEAIAKREAALEQLAQVAAFQTEFDGTILDFTFTD